MENYEKHCALASVHVCTHTKKYFFLFCLYCFFSLLTVVYFHSFGIHGGVIALLSIQSAREFLLLQFDLTVFTINSNNYQFNKYKVRTIVIVCVNTKGKNSFSLNSNHMCVFDRLIFQFELSVKFKSIMLISL